MIKALPDKWVRKYIFNRINNMVVNGVTFPCFTENVTGNEVPQHYVLLSTQTNLNTKPNRCDNRWESSILIDVFTRFISSGNTGSKLLADDAANTIIQLLQTFDLDAESGLRVMSFNLNMPNDFNDVTQNEIIIRKLLRYELVIE